MSKRDSDFTAELTSKLLDLRALQEKQIPEKGTRSYEEKKAVLIAFLDELINAPDGTPEAVLRREIQSSLGDVDDDEIE
jgi:hypothetical protein